MVRGPPTRWTSAALDPEEAAQRLRALVGHRLPGPHVGVGREDDVCASENGPCGDVVIVAIRTGEVEIGREALQDLIHVLAYQLRPLGGSMSRSCRAFLAHVRDDLREDVLRAVDLEHRGVLRRNKKSQSIRVLLKRTLASTKTLCVMVQIS